MSASEREWRLSPEAWDGAIARTEGPQIVVGGPGTGKTEFLVRRAVHLIESEGIDPRSLLLLSFGRRGATDLRERIMGRLDRSVAELDAGTFHGFAMRLLERFGDGDEAPRVLTGPEQVAVVRSLLQSEPRERWSPAFRTLLATKTFAREVTDFLLRCREQLIEPDDLRTIGADRADWVGLAEFMERYDAALQEAGQIDYGGLLAEAVRRLEDPAVAAEIAASYRYVLVDEYQDTTRAQARLLLALTAGHRNLVAAADPYQSVYSFRGADLENVFRFTDEFRDTAGRSALRIVLTTSFRVPEEILAAAERIASHELPGAAGPVVPAPGAGRVDIHRFEQETEEAEWVAAEILRTHLLDGVPYEHMAVFVRSKRRFLPELSRALERRNIPHDLPDTRLGDQPAVRFVLDCVIAATGCDGPAETTRALRRILLGPVFALPIGSLHDLERDRIRRNSSWIEALRSTLPDGGALADLLQDPRWAQEVPAVAGLWHLWSTLPALVDVVADPQRRDERLAWGSFAQVLERWNERNPAATLVDYLRLTEDEEFEARPLLSYRRPPGDRLTVTTLHQSKGLEFDTVFIADAVEGVFPDLRPRESLLGVRHLLPHVPTDTAEYLAFRLQEERRLAYTAMARATRRVVWTATAAGYDEGAGMPSRFLALVGDTASVAEAAARPTPHTVPVTPAEAEAHLRRILTDPSESSAARLAAATVLREGARWRLRPVEVIPGVRAAGPDNGLVGDPMRLSPSQAESYRTCPLRYAYERRLHVGDETSIHAEFGLLIHGVLEIAERDAVEQALPHGSLDRALEILAERFEPDRFGGEPFAAGWRARAETTLRRLYDSWPSKGVPVALEREFRIEIGGVEWVGIADRIEKVRNGIKVVDYKTTKNPPGRDEVAESLQLGFYALAAQADSELRAYGEPVAAEMWFPTADRKTTPVRKFEMTGLGDVAARLEEIADGIRAERWTATVNDRCDRCRLRPVCPEWPEGREAFRS